MHWGKEKLSLKQQAVFFSSLAEMMQAGFSLKKSLVNLQVNHQLSAVKSQQILLQLEQGHTLSQTLQPWLSQTTFFQLKIAEQHGSVEDCIQELGHFLFGVNEQLQKLRGLLLYPAMLFVLLGGLCGSIKIWLLPKLTEFSQGLAENDQQKVAVDWSQVVSWGWKLLLAACLIYALKVGYWWYRQKTLNRHIWYAQLPLVGRLYRLYSAYLISFNLSLLLRCGLDVHQVCCYLQEFKPQSLYYQLGCQLAQSLDQGHELSGFVRQYPFIPQELLFFLTSGDTKTELSQELALFAHHSYQNLVRESERLLTWIQPVLFLVIAGVIIGTYLAILLPIYSSIEGIY